MAEQCEANLERLPDDGPLDETDINFRAYLSRKTEAQLDEYDPSWTDDELMEWDGNFRNDGALMLTCCERDIDVIEFRQVLERYITYRRMHVS